MVRPSFRFFRNLTLSEQFCCSFAYPIFIQTQMAGTFSQPGPLVHLSEMSERNRTCQPGRVIPHSDVQPGPTTRQTLFSGRGDVPLSRHTVNKFRRPAVLPLNIESLTASKMNVLHHLAMQYEALVILLHETHCTCADKLTIPGFALAWSSLSRKHGLATFVHNGPLLISLQLHRRLSGFALTLMVRQCLQTSTFATASV